MIDLCSTFFGHYILHFFCDYLIYNELLLIFDHFVLLSNFDCLFPILKVAFDDTQDVVRNQKCETKGSDEGNQALWRDQGDKRRSFKCPIVWQNDHEYAHIDEKEGRCYPTEINVTLTVAKK